MAVQFPLLGEPLVIEFVNTDYVDPDGAVDFLGSTDLALGWLSEVAPERVSAPTAISQPDVDSLRKLRGAMRDLFDPATTRLDPAAVTTINHAASREPTARTLTCDDQGRPLVAPQPPASTIGAITSALASDAISVLVDESTGRAQICLRPACNMYFLQHHHRRRYCNPRCASAHRQSRYNQRRRPH